MGVVEEHIHAFVVSLTDVWLDEPKNLHYNRNNANEKATQGGIYYALLPQM